MALAAAVLFKLSHAYDYSPLNATVRFPAFHQLCHIFSEELDC